MREILFRFDDDETAANFLGWLSDGGGEQDFMDCEEEARGVALDFDYHARRTRPVSAEYRLVVVRTAAREPLRDVSTSTETGRDRP
jgi:hypothetical protein